MAHQLTQRADGFVEFAYLASDGEAWHKLGQEVPNGSDLQVWIEKSGMDWRIQRGKVRFNVDAAGTQVEMPDKHVLFRSDTKAPLGVVSDSYKAVQPGQVLEFFSDIARDQGIEITAAGTLFGGKRFWATAKVGEASPVSIKDRIGGYILLSTSADGTLATEARFTTIRVVCNNTLRMARATKAAVKLTHRSKFIPMTIHRSLGLVGDAWGDFQRQMATLADVSITTDRSQEFVLRLLSSGAQQVVEAVGPEADKVRESAGYQTILRLFNGAAKGSQLDGVRGTAYGLLNAVTEYADHHIRATSADNRFASAQWGPGDAMKSAAFEQLLAMAPAATYSA